ncbi:ATP-binding protein [Candidatus Berkiella aquae]|uniref:histidine kinase n=1 Tax=Candidatus Berkiella aquae TaxID=295108 RepID=A0A0Q9YJA8_9GAMM|nr:ATP-binding protein [Candidatus Berkiella aquae]MCS5710685.1 hypothetical protein [Candidatus Berkiella aquae]
MESGIDSFPNTEGKIQESISNALVRIAHTSVLVSIPVGMICATLVYFGLKQTGVPLAYLGAWYIALMAISVARLLQVWAYLASPKKINLHRKLFSIVSVLSGAIWGSAGFLLMPEQSLMAQMMIVIILAGISVGAIQSLQANLFSSISFAMLVALPTSFWFLAQEGISYLVLACTVFTYVFFLIVIAVRGNYLLKKSLKLHYTNAKLVQDLRISNVNLQESLSSISDLVEQLKKSKLEAEKANNFKSEFVANMSHELRTPLNAILGYSEILLEEAKTEGLQKYVEKLVKINNSGAHLLTLVNDILDLSKIESGKMDVYLENVAVMQLVKEVESILGPLFAQNKNSFSVKIMGDIPVIHTDLIKLKQCLINLLSNANKFTKEGTVQLLIENQKINDEAFVSFSIIDTGIGIPPEQFPNLFKIFSQTDSKVARNLGGTGLGLYLTDKLCKLLGGAVNVKSELGRGSTFIITLPQRLN